jgi:hypothetical protein
MVVEGHKPALTLLDSHYAVCRMCPDAPVPEWGQDGAFWSATRTADELSIVCEANYVPDDVIAEGNWRCLKVAGPLDFGMVGLLAGLTAVLAKAGISIFALSTYDTDYLLVRSARVVEAIGVLREAGYQVDGD